MIYYLSECQETRNRNPCKIVYPQRKIDEKKMYSIGEARVIGILPPLLMLLLCGRLRRVVLAECKTRYAMTSSYPCPSKLCSSRIHPLTSQHRESRHSARVMDSVEISKSDIYRRDTQGRQAPSRGRKHISSPPVDETHLICWTHTRLGRSEKLALDFVFPWRGLA